MRREYLLHQVYPEVLVILQSPVLRDYLLGQYHLELQWVLVGPGPQIILAIQPFREHPGIRSDHWLHLLRVLRAVQEIQ